MVSELKHFIVRRQVLGWLSLEETPGILGSSLPSPGVHWDEGSRLTEWCVAGG